MRIVQPPPRRQRSAYTMIELVVSLASSTILVAGLASTLYISSHAINTEANGNRHARLAGEILNDLMADMRDAKTFTERTATAVTFTVPDRNDDGNVETIRYAWHNDVENVDDPKPLIYEIDIADSTPGAWNSGTTYSENDRVAHDSGFWLAITRNQDSEPADDNADWRRTSLGGTATVLAADVQHFNLTALERMMLGASLEETPEASGGVVYEEFSENVSSGSPIVIDTPAGTVEGDLLIAAVAHDDGEDTLYASGWNLVAIVDGDGAVSFAVWWKIAGSSEPANYTFTWDDSGEEAYGWIMRFTGHDSANPIDAFNTDGGAATSTPSTQAVDTTVDNAMILRIGGFDDDDITAGDPGIAGHTSINMGMSSTGTGTASGGAGYMTLPSAGNSGTANFTLTSSEQFATVTIAIAPEAE